MKLSNIQKALDCLNANQVTDVTVYTNSTGSMHIEGLNPLTKDVIFIRIDEKTHEVQCSTTKTKSL